MLHLDGRLSALMDMIPQEGAVADIGCDHGRLACALLQRGQEKVYATDLSAPSLEKARRLAAKLGLEDRMVCCLGDGLTALNGEKASCLVIAGMSAVTIQGILEKAEDETLVLQPMMDMPSLRRYLTDHGWRIEDEDLVREERRFYPMLRAVRGEARCTEDELEFGPVLLRKRHPLLKDYWAWQAEVLLKSARQMEGEQREATQNKVIYLEKLTQFYCKNL